MHLNACPHPFKRKRFGKTLLMMKLTAIFLLAICLNTSATGLAQRVSLSEKNASLEKVFREIKKQTGYTFAYTKAQLQRSNPVTISINKAPMEQVLNMCFLDQPLSYTIIGKTVVVIAKKVLAIEVSPVPIESPVMIIKGKIINDKGEPLASASITEKGTNNNTLAKEDGSFSMSVAGAKSILVISYVGYTTREMTVGNHSNFSIALQLANQALSDIVVVGYGTQKKHTVTGAVTTVGSKELLKSPSSNVTNSLVGRLTGLSASQRSGQPGNNEALISIRGSATYNNNAAIVVVDGVERSGFGDLDPNEIETVTVLKDAASTAVFGIKGANGVIVITTKAGREGKPRISYSGNFSLQSYTGLPKTLNAYDNAFLMNEAMRNDNLAPKWDDQELQKFKDGSDPIGYPDINWFNYLTRKFYPQTQHNINISGGTKVIKYFASVGYLYEDGIFKEFESPYGFRTTPSYSRYNFRSNVDFNLSKNLTVGVRLGGRLGKRYQPAGPLNASNSFNYDNLEGMISRILQTPSFAYPVMLPDGRMVQNPEVGTNIWNPYAVITRWGTRNDDNNAMESTFNLNYKLDQLTKGLAFKAVFGYDSYYTSSVRRNASWAAYVVDRKSKAITLSSDRPRDEPLSGLNAVNGGTLNSNLQAGFNYDRSFRQHDITALALFTRQLISQEGSGFNAAPRASQGVVTRLTYNYDRKYFAEFNAAYNGSENFAPGYQYGFFPAVSAGWTVSNEKFMTDIAWISHLKFRGSYGLVGNDKLNNRFLFLDNYSVSSSGSYSTYTKPGNNVQFGLPTSLVTYNVVVPTSFGNPLVTWETGLKRNIGFEASFLNKKLELTIDLFDEKRKDILTERASGLLTYGQKYPAFNIGEVNNKGYEVELKYNNRIGKLNYGITSQLSFARNTIINRDEPAGMPGHLKQQGKRVGQFFGYMSDGFYTPEDISELTNNTGKLPVNTLGTPIAGDLKYKDIDGDGRINSDDMVAIGYSRTPEYIYSISPSISYKGISLTALFQGVANISSDVILSEQNNGMVMYEHQLGRWTPETAETASWPALHNRGNAYISYRLNDFILQDASYFKLRNAELSWTVPQRLINAVKISGLRVYLSGQNLVTWTKFKMYVDPENVNLSNTDFSRQSLYPSSRIFNFGLNIQL